MRPYCPIIKDVCKDNCVFRAEEDCLVWLALLSLAYAMEDNEDESEDNA